MIDENDSEYKLKDEDLSSEYLNDVNFDETKRKFSTPKISLSNINWRRFLVPIILIVSVFVVYIILNISSAMKNKAAESRSASMEQQAIVPQQSQEIKQAPQADMQSTSLANQINQLQGAMQQRLNVLEQYNASNRDQIAALNNGITKNQQDVAVLSQNITQLSEMVQQTLVELQKIEKAQRQPKKKIKSLKMPMAYTLRAIVPGRAWLESADGKTRTLKLGDKLEGYGEVQVISPRQGMVVMSSGSIIQYGAYDS